MTVRGTSDTELVGLADLEAPDLGNRDVQKGILYGIGVGVMAADAAAVRARAAWQ